jgi:hypothetical protein
MLRATVHFPFAPTTDVKDLADEVDSFRRQGRCPAGTGIAVAAAGVVGGAMRPRLTLLPSAIGSLHGYTALALTKALATVSTQAATPSESNEQIPRRMSRP